MVTVLLVFCYVPVGLFAAVMPVSWIRPIDRVFPFLALLPLVSVLMAWAAVAPLTSAFGYAVALVPLLISFASLALGLAGARLAFHAAREGRTWKSLAVLALLAGVPFLALAGLVAWEWAGQVVGRRGL